MNGDETLDPLNPEDTDQEPAIPQSNAEEMDYSSGGAGRRLTLDQAYDRIASKYGVPTTVWRAMIQQESGGNVNARSGAGARGAWQVMPATFKGLGYNPDTDFDNPLKVAEAGLRILRDNYSRFRPKARDEAHAWQMAIAGYHTNPNNVAQNLARGGDGIPNTYDPAAKITTRQHVANIFRNVDLSQLNRTPEGGSINTLGGAYEIPPLRMYGTPGSIPGVTPSTEAPTKQGSEASLAPTPSLPAPPPPPRLPQTTIAPPRLGRPELSQEDLATPSTLEPPRSISEIAPPAQVTSGELLPYVPPTVSYGGPLPGQQPIAEQPGMPAPDGKPQGVTPTPGETAPQQRGKKVQDNKGNVYEVAPNQSGIPKGSSRWVLREGPEATVTADSFGGITFIQEGNRIIREDQYNANQRAKKVYEEQDRDVAQRLGDGFYVNTGGASFTPSHLQALAKGNTALEKRIQALIQQTPGATDAALRPNVGYAAPVTIRVPYALQAALELNRQGIQFGNTNPESLIQQAINAGKLKFAGDRLTIGREQALTLLNASRPARQQAANRIIKELESGVPVSPEYWQQAQRAAGSTLLAHDPRLSFALRENQNVIDANEARLAEFGPSIQRYTAEAKAALESPEKFADYSPNFNLATLSKVPTEYRNAMAQILGQWKAGTLGIAQAQSSINRLYKEGNPIYQRAQTTLTQRQVRPTAIAAASQARFAGPETAAPQYKMPTPSDAEIQDYILRTSQVLTEDERKALRRDWMTRPGSWKTSVVGAGVAAAGGNLSRMLLGMFEDVLPTETVREWRAFNERGEVADEAITERAGRGWWSNLGQTVISTLADLPRFYALEATGIGLPALFAGDAMLQAKGRGASDEEILKEGAIGGAMGSVLWGAGKFGGFAKNWALAKGTPSLQEFGARMSRYAKANPEFNERVSSMMRAIIKNRENKEALIPFGAKIGSGRALTPEEEMRVLFSVLKKSDRPALTTPAERAWQLASKFSPLVEVGTVLTGVYGIQRASGASDKQAEDEAIKMAILHMGMSYGGKLVGPIAKRLGEAYEKLKGKWFRVDANGKPVDIIIDPNGVIHKASQPLDPKLIEAEIKTPRPGDEFGGQAIGATSPQGPKPPLLPPAPTTTPEAPATPAITKAPAPTATTETPTPTAPAIETPPTPAPPTTQGPVDGTPMTKRMFKGNTVRNIDGIYRIDDKGKPYIEVTDPKTGAVARQKMTTSWSVAPPPKAVTAPAPPTPPMPAPPTAGPIEPTTPPQEPPPGPPETAGIAPSGGKSPKPVVAPTPSAKPAPEDKAAVVEAKGTPVLKKIDIPVADGKTPIQTKLKEFDNLPTIQQIPDITRGKGTDVEVNSRELYRQLKQSVKDSVKEYNDARKEYNDALASKDENAIRAKVDELNFIRDGIINRIARINRLAEGKTSYVPSESTPVVKKSKQVKPRVRKKAEQEILETPPAPAPTQRIELEPVKGVAPKNGDTIYKPFPYAPNGYFEGKFLKDPARITDRVIYIDPRTGKKKKAPFTDAWSTAKPVPADQAKPAPKAKEAPVGPEKAKAKTNIDKNEVVHWTDEKGLRGILDKNALTGGSVTTSLDLPFDIDNNLKFGIILLRKVVEKYGFKALPKDALGVTPAEKQFELRGTKEVPMTEAQIAFVVRSKKAADALRKILNEYGLGGAEIRIAKKPKFKTLEEVGETPVEPEGPSTPKEPGPPTTGADKGGLTDEDYKNWADALHPNDRAEIRSRMQPDREGGPQSATQVSYEMGIPVEVIKFVPEKGPLGPFGQMSHKMRGWLETPEIGFLEDLAPHLEPRVKFDTPTERIQAANVIMDALAKLSGKPRSSTLNKEDYDKIFEVLIPKVTKDSALRLIEAADYQSLYSKAIRDLQTNAFWRSIINDLRKSGYTSWNEIPTQTQKDLLRLARAVGDKYGPRKTKTGKQANLFTKEAIARAFDETLGGRGRPLFEDAFPVGTLRNAFETFRKSNEEIGKIDNSVNSIVKTDPFGKTQMTKNPDTVGTSLNQKVLSNRLSQLSAVNAIDAAVVTETRRQAELINNKMHALRKASLPEIARKLQFYSPEPGVILCNAEATALFNLAHFGHIEASGLTATNTPSKPFARVYAELDNLARSLYKDGEIDAANNVWAFAQLHSQAERSSEFRDVVLAIFDPEAPVYCQHTLQEEMEHRDDVRTRRVLVDIDGINYLQLQQTPSMKLTPSLHMIPPPKNWMRLKIFQGALNTMKSGPYRNKTTGQWYAEIIAKSLRYDGELELNITPKERIAIVKYYVKHIIREQIRPEDLMVLRTHNSGRSRELQEIYAKEYERKYPNAAQRAGVGKSAVADDSLRKIWREWVGENVPATPIPAQYVAQVSVSQAKGKPQTVITTPKLPQRLTMRIIRDDGQYLQTPNNPEVKLSEEDIQAIQSSNDVDRVWMEDAIYAANISKRSLSSDKYNLDLTPLPNKFDFAKDFADLPKMSSLLPTSKISPSTAFKEGAKLSWGIWKSKTALRASADLSALRQGARLWSSQKLFFKELNEEGRQAVAINQQLDKDIAKWTRMIAKAKEDLATGTPLEWEIKAQKGITRAGVERAIERWQRSAEDAEARKIKITRAMRDIRISTLLGHQLGAIHLGAKAENWTGNITTRLGQFPGAKYLKGKTGGVIPGMRWYAETTWNHPNYKFFKNELGLDFGGLVKPEVGFEVANGFNTGKVFIKEYAIRPVGSGANMVPDLKVLNQIRKNNPEREVTVTYDAKQKIFIASVERVKIDNQDKDVPMTFDWRTYGEGTTQLSEIFGKGIFSRVPFINSKYGKRTMKRALASKDWQNIAGWVANRARQKNPVTAVIQMSENSYGTSLGWLRFKAMQERLKDLTVSFAMEGKSTDLQSPEFLDALREAARFINMASGSYKAKSDTKVGKFVENFVRPALSKILFSFNFTASAPGFWNPRTLLNAPKYVRASMVQGWIQRAAFLGTMLSLLNYFTDAEFTYDDPSDMGFLKLKIGPKTVDITSGDSKFLIAMARTAQLFGDWAFPPKKGLYDTKKDSTLLDVLSNTMRLWTRYFLLSANPQVQDIYAGLANKTVMGDPTTFREHFLKTWLPLTAEAALESLSTDMSAWSTLVEFYGGNVNELATIQGVEAQRRKDWIANRGDRERQERVDAQWAAKLQYMQREQDRLRKYKDKPWILERLWKGIVEGPAPSGVLGETDNQVSEPTMNFSEKDKNQ